MKKKSIALLMACALVFGVSVGGTMAWLTAETGNVVNTFTVGDINIELTETGISGTNGGTQNFNFVPGDTRAKDPKVTVTAGSEACYLFVKVTEENNYINDSENDNQIVDWDVKVDGTNEWIPVGGETGFWYREVEKGTGTNGFAVFTDPKTDDTLSGSVIISTEVTKTTITSGSKPTITISAAAVQKDHVDTVTEAWAKLPTSFTGETSGSQNP